MCHFVLINAAVKHHLELYSEMYTHFVQLFLRSAYVNNVSLGTGDEDNAYELYLKSKKILKIQPSEVCHKFNHSTAKN